MADLHNKLAMRRKGISGVKETIDSAPSMIDRISSMIPPPHKRSNDSESSDNVNEDEWN